MEKMIETKIVEIDKFSNTVSVNEEVYLYRRLIDIYDPTAVAILNTKNEVVGYLNRNVAETIILPKIRKGVRFKCFVTGTSDEEGIPISIIEAEDFENLHKESKFQESITPNLRFTDRELVDDEDNFEDEEEEIEYSDLDDLDVDEDDEDDWN
jgi:hypothetical protein